MFLNIFDRPLKRHSISKKIICLLKCWTRIWTREIKLFFSLFPGVEELQVSQSEVPEDLSHQLAGSA